MARSEIPPAHRSGRSWGLGENQHPAFQHVVGISPKLGAGRTLISQASELLCYRANTFIPCRVQQRGPRIVYTHPAGAPLVLFGATPGCPLGTPRAHPRSPRQDGPTLLSPLLLSLIQTRLRSVGGWNSAPPQCHLLFVWCW